MSTRPIGDLKADAENPRTIDEAALAGLGVSLEDFGDLSGIVFNKRTGELVAGHQRVDRLSAAGATEWTTSDDGTAFVVHPTTGERFPIRIVDWPIEKQRAANLVANNPTIQGAFTVEAVRQLEALREHAHAEALRLPEMQAQIQAELDRLRRQQKSGEGATDPDAVPEPPAVPVTQPGDLWILGAHRLLCGDSTSGVDVDRLMDGQRAVLMSTDPPYGVDYNEVKANIPNSSMDGARFKDWGDIANDALTPEQLGAFLLAAFRAALLVDVAAIYAWHPSGPMTEVFRASMASAGFLVHRQIIWVKPGFVLTRSGMYHWAHEPCFYGWKKGSRPPWYGDKNQTSVWHVGRDSGKAVHPTQKPVELFEIPMRNHTRPGEVCYEPFSGSGSQIIAGERLERRVFAMELSPRWCDAAVLRWEAFTQRKAERQPA